MKLTKQLLSILGNERGNLTAAAVMVGAATVIALGVFKFSEKASLTRQAAANESYARLNNDVVTSRLGHAVGSNAVMCSEVSGSCFWNDKFKPTDFGLDSVKQDGKVLKVVSKNCLPASTDRIDLTNCKDVVAEAEVRMTDFNSLQDAKMVAGVMKAGDKDHYGALVSVKTNFQVEQAQKTVTTSSLIRRPRALLRVVAGQAICANTCQVPVGTKSNFKNTWCFGPVEIENDQSHTSVKVSVVNDGPGHIYRFRVKRSYQANANFSGGGAVPDQDVFDSAKVIPAGLAPGEKYEFMDDKIPCFDEKITHHQVVRGGAGTVVTVAENARNSKPSGTASYAFVNDTIEPNNALLLGMDGTTVPATSTVTTVTTFISGMN